ncbi:UDP-N-acetylmuramoyl-L-alanine--D-glutamate ligase [Lampropedia puyangensis]|uniref:UDP-N-acetylmuramoylalanine--D-glutamate ligase n=1 Tax=Lampropedia puyangensis TaxID=1330072 RepID=A0A4S8EP44_9BURK|nr:UDP-N-acetylmuramoyl-L-alanine--D-glutamate ligase [Lampropedia puyangensis]THT96469.1 UDP-N-acetylmuramoyl-L-alanine--D-glutamate ligase [Lampropedia puyangensis]
MSAPVSSPLVLILGLGISGLAMARWCASQGMRVRVADTRTEPPHAHTLQNEVSGVECVVGQPLSAQLLCSAVGHVEASAVYCSPGLPLEQVAPVREAAANAGVFFGGELDLFSQALHQLQQQHGYTPHVLAITGTNGKTTVTSLTGQLLSRVGMRVAVAGNIGPSLLDTLAQAMGVANAAKAQQDAQTSEAASESVPVSLNPDQATDMGEPERLDPMDDGVEEVAQTLAEPEVRNAFVDAMPQAWVLELSSFQLEYSTGFEPTAAVILNISQDHLDWHGSAQAYLQAKAKIYGNRATIVLNRDDVATVAFMPQVLAKTQVLKTGRTSKSVAVERSVIRFGLDLPELYGDWGVETINGMLWLARVVGDESLSVQKTTRGRKAQVQELFMQRLMPADAMRIRGRHNVSNALAALALSSTTGAGLAAMLHGLREYRGEPHRVQTIGVVAGVEYIDDSKGTNVGATEAALRGLAGTRKLVVILGGDGKGQDFSPLAQPVQQAARAVVLIGRDAQRIAQALAATEVPMVCAESLEAAVEQASALAHEGDAVLLSPACASLDMFKNYAHRAEVFTERVRALALDAGHELEVWA